MHRYTKVIHHLPTLLAYTRSRGAGVHNPEYHLRLAAGWLLRAQPISGGGGYAHSYHLLYGWQASYPETTGYIIPTMLRAGKFLKDDRLISSARAALEWLLTIQANDGSFADLQGQSQVFDTGQILIGLSHVHENRPDWPPVHDNIIRAARWLKSVQEDDGSFISSAYNNRPHTYYSRVGAAMIKAGHLLDDDAVTSAGVRHLEWVVSQQMKNGFFNHASFDAHPPFLHTMVYILEGLLDGYHVTGDARYRYAVEKCAAKLIKSKPADDVLRSQYHDDFTIANPHICVTGLAQWAGVCTRLGAEYKAESERACAYVARHQIVSSNANLHGGLTGSLPVHGNYLRMAIPNWGLKFFMDALLDKAGA